MVIDAAMMPKKKPEYYDIHVDEQGISPTT